MAFISSQFVGPAGSTATTLAVTVVYRPEGFGNRYFNDIKKRHYRPISQRTDIEICTWVCIILNVSFA